MINKALGVILAVVGFAGMAQAQTITLVNNTFNDPPGGFSFIGTPSFSVSGAGSLFIVGSVITNALDVGTGLLTGSGGYSNQFTLTDGSTGAIVFEQFSLTQPGTYTFSYEFTNPTGSTNLVGIDATVTPVPEPQTYALLLAGLFVLGVSTRRRLVKI